MNTRLSVVLDPETSAAVQMHERAAAAHDCPWCRLGDEAGDRAESLGLTEADLERIDWLCRDLHDAEAADTYVTIRFDNAEGLFPVRRCQLERSRETARTVAGTIRRQLRQILTLAGALIVGVACTKPVPAPRPTMTPVSRVAATPGPSIATPTPAPTPTPVPVTPVPDEKVDPPPVAMGTRPVPVSGPIQAAIRDKFGAQARRALAIAHCETGGTWDPHSTGSRGERGIFQIHPVHKDGAVRAAGYTWDQMYEVTPNLDVAYRISRGGTDWHAWSCA